MKSIYLAATASLLLVACSPETKTAASPTKPKEVATGSKKFDLDCLGIRTVNGKNSESNIRLHIDLGRMVYSAKDDPHLYPIAEVTAHTLFLQNDPGEYFVINRGSGKLIADSRSANFRTESVCSLHSYTDLGQVF